MQQSLVSTFSPNIREALQRLAEPFPPQLLRARVGAVVTKDNAEPFGIALFYGEWWTTYLPRLNEVIGPEGPATWTISPQVWGDRMIAVLSAFNGQLHGFSSGEAENKSLNRGTSSEAQAKKRVCAEVLGLGRYLYAAPTLYGRVVRSGQSYQFVDGEEQRLISRFYTLAGYTNMAPMETPHADFEPPCALVPPPTGLSVFTTRPSILVSAPTALAPEKATKPATLRQLGAIASLVIRATEPEGHPAPERVLWTNQLGSQFGLAALASVNSRQKAKLLGLTVVQASGLIRQLQQGVGNQPIKRAT